MSARGFSAVGLYQPKTPINVGSVLRASQAYGVAMVAYTGQRFSRAPTDTTKGSRHVPLLNTNDLRSMIPHDCVPVAVDLIDGARSLVDYVHPERAFYVFGPEDGTLGPLVTSWCRDVIYLPTSVCLNLATCVTTVLYDRLAKENRASNVVPFAKRKAA